LPPLVDEVRGIEHAYAAADVVALPSHYEGFGNPAVEASLHYRPVVVGQYPVAQELRGLGFRWLLPGDEDAVRDFMAKQRRGRPGHDDEAGDLLRHNAAVARRHLNLRQLGRHLSGVLAGLGLHTPVPWRGG
jgi:mannosylglucosylglycerate synthase